ncbi:unnamed protein product, partial [Laminaria digitata]
MDNIIHIIAMLVFGGVIGFLISRFLLKKSADKKKKEAEDKAALIVKEAELTADNIKKDRILEAKEKFLKLKSEFEEESNRKRNQIISNEQKLKKRDDQLNKQISQNKRAEAELESMKENVSAQMEIVKKRKEDMERIKEQQVAILEKVANLTADDARDQLMETLKDEARTHA